MASRFGSSAATITLARPERAAASSPARLQATATRVLRHVEDLGLACDSAADIGDLAALTATVEDAAEHVARAIAARSAPQPLDHYVALLVELRDLRGELAQRSLASRLEALAQVHAGLELLRDAGSPAELLAGVPEAVCGHCGFDRCVISRVSDGDWIIENAHFVDDAEAAERYLAVNRDRRFSLEPASAEREIVRRRASLLVSCVPDADRMLEVVPEGTTSYVGAPLTTRDRVIGVVHADHGPGGRPVDDLDELTLAAFADGVSHLYEHVLLVRRLATQHEHVRRMVTSTGVLLDDLAMADIALAAPADRGKHHFTSTTMFEAPSTRVGELLTKRELEVLQLMALGDSNTVIAEKLVIAEGTAKSHVKHILRKLRASNRAEAIARYLNSSRDDVAS